MKIQIVLHSSLRSLLPAEAKGRTTLDLPDGSRLSEVVDSLRIPSGTVCAVNGQIEADEERLLADGDEVRFLRRSAGG